MIEKLGFYGFLLFCAIIFGKMTIASVIFCYQSGLKKEQAPTFDDIKKNVYKEFKSIIVDLNKMAFLAAVTAVILIWLLSRVTISTTLGYGFLTYVIVNYSLSAIKSLVPTSDRSVNPEHKIDPQ